MPSVTHRLTVEGLIHPPGFLPTNVMYETLMGSIAYGVSTDKSDRDVYGFCIPPKGHVFPHLQGEILGFGTPRERFEQFQVAHIEDPGHSGGEACEWDLSIYGIVKYLSLCMECNPNMIDSLFTDQDCVLHITKVGALVRERRQLFLHKGCWPRFKGYAYTQLHKLRTKEPVGKRKRLHDEFGFDTKFAYHAVRLLGECEQILLEGDIDLKRDREHLTAIRSGEVSKEEILSWAADKEKQLEELYQSSKIPTEADEAKIRELLLNCLEQHYGRLQDCVAPIDAAAQQLREINAILQRSRNVWDG
ncbi:MAG: nucleotidyltransferase domain-containing protein [Planctomycetaceae bacterium]|nr:nucleotidyltransferase domain-containing protein [Planctomycetaceae bacterium]